MKFFTNLLTWFVAVSVTYAVTSNVLRYFFLNTRIEEPNTFLIFFVNHVIPFSFSVYGILGALILTYIFIRWCLFLKNRTLQFKKTFLYIPIIFVLYLITFLSSYDLVASVSPCTLAMFEGKNIFTGEVKTFSTICTAPFWYIDNDSTIAVPTVIRTIENK